MDGVRGHVHEVARTTVERLGEGLSIQAGPSPTSYRDGSMGWFVDEPWYGFPGGGGMRTRLTAVVAEEAGQWKVVHLHVSVGVPDEEVQDLHARWSITSGSIPRRLNRRYSEDLAGR